MSFKRRYRRSDPLGGLILLFIIGLVVTFYTNKTAFFQWLLYIEIGLLPICAIGYLYLQIKEWMKRKKKETVKRIVTDSRAEEPLNNFINRFGTDKSKNA